MYHIINSQRLKGSNLCSFNHNKKDIFLLKLPVGSFGKLKGPRSTFFLFPPLVLLGDLGGNFFPAPHTVRQKPILYMFMIGAEQ